ncbi:MAG: hypothetical protein LBG79_07515 [Spirochaetaceae bacterium]|jgi:hypothetical protein|nr:hypothetical protein [Spirochaetaceae bacterium]
MKNGNTPGRNAGANRRRNRSKNRESGRKQTKENERELDYLANARRQSALQNKIPSAKRPRWTEPSLLKTPIPSPPCPLCGEPVKELAEAITDKISGLAAHFDCVRKRVCGSEQLEDGEQIAYIGGGRFGVIHFKHGHQRGFTIKKIIELEQTETRAEWRSDIADHFSIT